MSHSINKYLYSIFFGLVMTIMFELISNTNFPVIVLLTILLGVAICVTLIGWKINHDYYKNSKFKSIAAYIVISFILFISSTIGFMYVANNIERRVHVLNSENYGSAILMLLIVIVYGIGFLISFLLPMISNIFLQLKQYQKENKD